ncbi:toll/interleukin-1 receptor domain-containing protein [Dietzia cinnamea]|uniref:toll/interleukin-1 receptor domain-containing protein n=1 Tax=Dietzia cinnamea TaxID=321318 RepID=UPI00223AE27F|nr:toll/interleukin-1 receptor domain-containing protein [Dietzia cinnamea]MCT2076069.1 toll/interleukin-1 receptor domain-containing protein [Dietzia cinnamea]MCT2219790.1 toll/interleukin-1 receptor domain-containing protein [Dietzia cinnamea]
MGLTRAERFKIKSALVDLMNQDFNHWDFARQNMLLSEFKLDPLDDDYNGPTFADAISNVSDADLIELYTIVAGQEPDELTSDPLASQSGPWQPGMIRLFISHSAAHKEFIGQVSRELAVVGVDGFVAHDHMENAKPFQDQIEQALTTMDAFVALVHPEFNGSAWCQQEVGWAYARRVPLYAVRLGDNPQAFVARDQWPSLFERNPREIADEISDWIGKHPLLSDRIIDGLFASLSNASNYESAGATANRIARLPSLTDEQWSRLDEIYFANDQVEYGVLPSRALKPFYAKHNRTWPPPKPNPEDEPPW